MNNIINIQEKDLQSLNGQELTDTYREFEKQSDYVKGAILENIFEEAKYMQLGYKRWEEYLPKELNISKQTAGRLREHFKSILSVKTNLEHHLNPDLIEEILPTKEQTQAVKDVPIEDIIELIEHAGEEGIPKEIEVAILTKAKKIIDEKSYRNVHVSKNTGENEWYTPTQFIESARIVMGSIDLDPASCEMANVNVKANVYFTMETNGLEQKWEGNVWMNPPYDKTIKEFSIKAVEERDNYSQLIVLVNNATETEWFTSFVEIATAICFIKSRVKFIDKEGKATGAPLQGQAIIYIGDNIESFREEFLQYGFICTL